METWNPPNLVYSLQTASLFSLCRDYRMDEVILSAGV